MLHGLPGIGKSHLTAFKAKKIFVDNHALATSFFFSIHNPNLKNPLYPVLAIARGIALFSSDLQHLIYGSICTTAPLLYGKLYSQFDYLVARPLQQWKGESSFLGALDGLDQ